MRILIDETINRLLNQEDTDGDKKITIEDNGPKAFDLTLGKEKITIKGTYFLSNLLQELIIAKNQGRTEMDYCEYKIHEPPQERISRMIREFYWDGLTRTLDKKGIPQLIADTKNNELKSNTLRIYIPYNDENAQEYFHELKNEFPIQVEILPKQITPEFVKSLDKKPGILSLKLTEINGELIGAPFVVPGGRFNEMYGWDSYFQNIGLLLDGKLDLAKSVVDNFQYEIEHYGKILNANRSYYLTRTQPPFYTSMIADVFSLTNDIEWLRTHFATAIKEYHTVWMEKGKRLTGNGLNRYLAEGIGMPPEAEEGHFDKVFNPFLKECDLPLAEFIQKYQHGEINTKELNAYFVHDRSVRESGHDTTYRLEGICADLNLVELNCMLYQYECHFADWTEHLCGGTFEGYTTEHWKSQAEIRKRKIQEYMWNESAGIFYDYNFKTKTQHNFLAATCFFPLWAGIASAKQARRMVDVHLPKLIEKGGIVGCTEEALKKIGIKNYDRQWDYPNGWAPHQMIIWKGLLNYGFDDLAKDLIERWIGMITKNAMDYNGTIPEKYDVVNASHKVFSEYGNVGTNFEYITKEGFGWMNASYQLGRHLLNEI